MTQNYHTMSDAEKQQYLRRQYCINKLSIREIAKECDTYSNKIRRDAMKCGITMRDKSESQKVALATGRGEHPTKGKKLPEDTKKKIGIGVSTNWENAPKEAKQKKSQTSAALWQARTDEEHEKFLTKSRKKIRDAAVYGSKLEKFLRAQFLDTKYNAEFHKKYLVTNERIHLDLFIHELGTAIEVDGPHHHESVWGDKQLDKVKKTDRSKDGLLVAAGYNIVRINGGKGHLSHKKKDEIWSELIAALEWIERNGVRGQAFHIGGTKRGGISNNR